MKLISVSLAAVLWWGKALGFIIPENLPDGFHIVSIPEDPDSNAPTTIRTYPPAIWNGLPDPEGLEPTGRPVISIVKDGRAVPVDEQVDHINDGPSVFDEQLMLPGSESLPQSADSEDEGQEYASANKVAASDMSIGKRADETSDEEGKEDKHKKSSRPNWKHPKPYQMRPIIPPLKDNDKEWPEWLPLEVLRAECYFNLPQFNKTDLAEAVGGLMQYCDRYLLPPHHKHLAVSTSREVAAYWCNWNGKPRHCSSKEYQWASYHYFDAMCGPLRPGSVMFQRDATRFRGIPVLREKMTFGRAWKGQRICGRMWADLIHPENPPELQFSAWVGYRGFDLEPGGGEE